MSTAARSTVGANNWTYEGYVNLPLVEGQSALRISAYSVQDGGYIDNLLETRHWLNGTTSTNGAWAGDNYNTRDVIGTRIGLQQNFPDNWSLTLTGTYQRQLYRGSWEEDPTRVGPLNLERFAPQGGYDYDRFLDLHVEGDVGIGDLVYVGGYTAQRKRRLYDYSEYAQYSGYSSYVQASACSTDPVHGAGYSGCNVPYMYAQTDGLIQQWSNELRLQSKPGGRAHWTVGTYWEKIYDPYSGFIRLPGIKLGGEQAQYLIAEYHNLATPRPEEWYLDYGDDHYRQLTEFADLTYDLDPHWSVEGGIQHYHSSVSETDIAGPYWAEKVPDFHSTTSNRTNFKAGVNFKPTGHQLMYFSFAQGYRDGGFNYVSQYDNPAYPRYFKPDYLDNYELGNKSEFFAGRMVWNSALYYMRWVNYQVVVNVPDMPHSLSANAGNARIYGLESSLELRPMEGLSLSFDGNYNDARIKTSTYQSPVFTVLPGERLPEAPYFNYNAIARYDRPITRQLRTFLQFDAAHKGDMWNDLREDVRTMQPAYTVGNLRSGLSSPASGWTAELYVTNVSNKRAVIFANYTGFSRTDIPNQPRVFGLLAKLPLGENMTTDSRSAPPAWKARWAARIKNAIPGMKYATLVTLGLMLGWDVEGFIDDVPKLGWLAALKGAGFFMLVMALHQLPPIPAVAVAVEVRTAHRHPPLSMACERRHRTLVLLHGVLVLSRRARHEHPLRLHGRPHRRRLRLPQFGPYRIQSIRTEADRRLHARRRCQARPFAALTRANRAPFSVQHARDRARAGTRRPSRRRRDDRQSHALSLRGPAQTPPGRILPR